MRRSSPPASSAARLRLADPLERPPSEEVERRSATASAAEPACAGLDTAQGRRPRAAIISAIPRLSLGYPSAFPRLSLGFPSAIPRLCLCSVSATSRLDHLGRLLRRLERVVAGGRGRRRRGRGRRGCHRSAHRRRGGGGRGGGGRGGVPVRGEGERGARLDLAQPREVALVDPEEDILERGARHAYPRARLGWPSALAGPRPWLALGLPPAREPRSARLAEVGHTERYISAVPRPHLGCISARSRRGRPRRATSETPTASSERGPTCLFGDSSVTPSETPRRRRRRRAAAAARRRAAGTRPSPRRAKIAPRRLPPS